MKGQPANLIVRLLVGLVFLPEGIKKFLFPEQWGVGRFARIGIPAPEIMAHLVGVVEILAGALILVGLVARPAAVLLLVDILVAIITTKLPLLWRDGGTHQRRMGDRVASVATCSGPGSLDSFPS